MSDVLAIPGRIADELLAHARAELPNEACGLLSGDAAAGAVTAFHPARNRLASATAFEVHPEDLVRIVLGIERSGSDLVAIAHSHPRSAAQPSPTDLREAAYQVVQVIVGRVADVSWQPDLRAWRYEGNTFRQVVIEIT